MKHSIYLIAAIIHICVIPLYSQDIYRLIDPVNGGSKSPNDGPPFLRFGSIQQYYHPMAFPLNYLSDASASFEKWNSAGSVQFSSSESSGLTLTVFWNNYGYDFYPNIVNPGKTYGADNNYIIDVNSIYILLNTWHQWGIEQDLRNQRFDVQTILVHEIGHVHGLDHPEINSYTHDATAPIMAGADNEYFWDHTARDLRIDDINGTRFLQYNTWVPNQCATIQSALNNSFSEGTIHINSGTYNENLIVGDKDNLSIIGQGAASTIINGNLTAYFCDNLSITSLRLNSLSATYCNLGNFYNNINRVMSLNLCKKKKEGAAPKY